MNIGVIEARGDEALKLQQYDKAKEFYLQSQALYQGINDMDKVAEVQEKNKSGARIARGNTKSKRRTGYSTIDRKIRVIKGRYWGNFFTCEKFPQAPSKTRLEHERKDRGTLSHCPQSPFKGLEPI